MLNSTASNAATTSPAASSAVQSFREWRTAENPNHLPVFMRSLDGQQCLVALVEELTSLTGSTAALPQHASMGAKLENARTTFVDHFLWCLARHGWTLQPSSENVQFDSLVENLKLFQGMSQDKRAAYLASGHRIPRQ